MQPDLAPIEELGYNSNEDANEPKEPIKIDMRRQKPIHDPQCEHEYILDPTDPDSDWVDVYRCSKCPFGKLVSRP